MNRKQVVVLGLMNEDLGDLSSQLIDSFRACATVARVETKTEFNKAMKTRPSAVLAIDAAISKPENAEVTKQLYTYVMDGGTLICCFNFSNRFDYVNAGSFFDIWHLPWDAGSYLRTTVHRTKQTVKGMSTEGLPASFSMKSLYLTNVPANQAIYNPSSASRIESRVFDANLFPIDPTETPCAFAPVGRGFFGFVGDVNCEEAGTRVIMAMANFPQSAVVRDTREQNDGIVLTPEGVAEPAPSRENHLAVYSDAIRQAGGEMHSGAKLGDRIVTMPTPPQPPQYTPFQSSPPQGPAERAKVFKEKGNDLFAKGDYQGAVQAYEKAINVHGEQPIYLTNLAAAYLKLNKTKAAVEVCDKALRQEARNLKARYRRGLARRELMLFPGALQDFNACLKLAPNDSHFQTEIDKTWERYNQMKGGYAQLEAWSQTEAFCEFDPPL